MKKAPWFNERKFGIFVHYGLYSQHERGEWAMYQEKTPCEEYARLADTFDPCGFDAERLVQQAKEAGAGYMVLTANHHEGFCLFDTKHSDFNSVHYCGRDFIAEYVAACRKKEMKIGLYYSLLDWRYKGYHNREKYPESLQSMVQRAHMQVRELLTNYGRIDYLFFDGGWFPDVIPTDQEKAAYIAKIWKADELLKMIRALQPDILTNERSGFPGDVLTPEQTTEASSDERYSEACMTIGDRWGWGYIHHNPNLKSTRCLLQHMVIQASLGGNFLLNVGPAANGEIRDCEERVLCELGQWLRTNGTSLYGTTAPSDPVMSIVGECTQKDHTLFFHVFRWPHKGEAILSGLSRMVKSVRLLESGKECHFTQTEMGRLIIHDLPYLPPDSKDTVLQIDLQPDSVCSCQMDYGIL